MTFTQQSFLGASIRSFNARMGWGSSPSSLSVELVCDPYLNEVFSPVAPGQPVLFNYSGWQFGGILQSWKKNRSESGNPTYSVEVLDPRELLSGVQLIIDSYLGQVYSVPNIYNVFGYAESVLGFGGAGVNEGGMPWTIIRDGFNSLQTSNPVNLAGYPLRVDLSNLPNLPEFHRITGPTISLMDYISNMCDSAGCDFFFNLSFSGNTAILTLYTISRKDTPRIGAINDFIAVLSNYNSSDVGLEFRNEATNKFLIGGKMQKLFVQTQDRGEDEDINENDQIFPRAADDTIYPYFGVKEDGTGVKFLEGIDELFKTHDCLYDNNNFFKEQFDAGNVQNAFGFSSIKFEHPQLTSFMNGRPGNKVNFPWFTDNKYHTNMQELRAALSGQDVWENFLFMHNLQDKVKKYIPDFANSININIDVDNIHKGKYSEEGLNLLGLFNKSLGGTLSAFTTIDKLQAFLENDLSMAYLLENKQKNIDLNKAFTAEQQRAALYGIIHQFASTYFGRQYMVATPFVVGKINTDEDQVVTNWIGDEESVPGNKIVTSLEPTEGGYIDNVDYEVTNGANGSTYTPVARSEFAKMVEEKILPLDVRKFQTNDGRITAIARFQKENGKKEVLDISALNPADYIEYNDYYYVKCQVEPNLVFADSATLFSPRAVITLPGFIGTMGDNLRWQALMMKNFVKTQAGALYSQNAANKTAIDGILDAKFGNGVNTDLLNDNTTGFPVAPSMVIVPLKSNIYTYGPWYAIGGNGKTEVDTDEDLVPWKYGSYNLMNQSAQARIEESSTSQQFSETGNVTFAGVPAVQLGALLISGGPYLTDVNVQIGADGATTTYSFATWTKRFGTIPKEFLDKQRKTGELLKRQRSALFNKAANNTIIGQDIKAISLKPKKAPRRVESSSTHSYLISEKDGQKHAIAFSPSYNAADQTSDPENKALTTLDTLFVPFSTKIFNTDTERAAANISHLEYPSGQVGLLNATGLNPYLYPHPFNAIMRDDDEWDQSFSIENSGLDDTDGYRPFAIRMPAIFSGWGVDTNNKPVPAKVGEPTKFADDYRTNVTKWKTGPLLTKWNDKAKGWEASGNSTKLARTTQYVPFRGSGMADIYDYNQDSGRPIKTGSEMVYDYLLASGAYIYENTNIFYTTINGRNYIINASCSTDPI